MNYSNVFIYMLIFVILLQVFISLYRKRIVNFLFFNKNIEGMKENMIGLDDNEEYKKIKNNKDFLSIGNIQSMQSKYANLPLKEYCIKTSYNSATTGKSVNKNMVKFVLSRGCRLLDFEVFYTKKNNTYMPVVAESTDPEFKLFDTDNSISLESVFSTVISNAFSNTSPNKKDPLFIHLRIKTKDTNCYAEVAKLMDSILKPKLFEGEVTKETKLSELLGKIVIVVDKTIHRDYKEYAKCKSSDTSCYDLSNYANVESGSQIINALGLMQLENQAFNPPLIKDDNTSTTVQACKIVLPIEKSKNNADMKKMILNHGIQMVGYKYNVVDENLMDCETFFNDNKGGIVPLAAAIPYFERMQKELNKKK